MSFKVFRDEQGACYHVKVKKGEVTPNVIICGAPERVELVGEQLKKTKVLSRHRGLLCLRGTYEDIEVTAVCGGMGPASTAIVLPEILDSIDIKTEPSIAMVRLGTAGAMQEYVHTGHLVVANGSIREEATTGKLAPLTYPAIAGTKVSMAALAAGVKQGKKLRKDLWFGPTVTKDEFYVTEWPEGYPLAHERQTQLRAYTELGAVATEMEFSVLNIYGDYFQTQMRQQGNLGVQVETGCVLLIAAESPVAGHGEEFPFSHADQEEGVKVSLETLRIYRNWQKGKVPPEVIETLKQL